MKLRVLLLVVKLGVFFVEAWGSHEEKVLSMDEIVDEGGGEGRVVPLFSCPQDKKRTTISKAENDFEGYWTTYQEMNKEKLEDADSILSFRDRMYDYRWMSYTEMKSKTFAWKRDFFGSALLNGDHIYESACGQGLNLLQTLETLRECCGIVNLTVHGNDYLSESIQVAHAIYHQEAADWFSKGNLCQGDSTNLSHVPNDSMDLAYTGFIDPLLDPLKLMHDSVTLDEKVEMVEEICTMASEQQQHDSEVALLAMEMQRLQEDWHAKWVSELIRIVKPGKYVIVEDVGWPACTFITEWGGVEPEWWRTVAVERYGWDVEVDSIELVQEQEEYLWYPNRYNVRMMKKKKTPPEESYKR